jgi:hypothetical protein
MSNLFDDLCKGDRIEHATMGAGTVTETTHSCLVVTYDEGTVGCHSTGMYAREWFDWYPKTIRKARRDIS